MLSVEECKKYAKDCNYSDEEIKRIREFAVLFAYLSIPLYEEVKQEWESLKKVS